MRKLPNDSAVLYFLDSSRKDLHCLIRFELACSTVGLFVAFIHIRDKFLRIPQRSRWLRESAKSTSKQTCTRIPAYFPNIYAAKQNTLDATFLVLQVARWVLSLLFTLSASNTICPLQGKHLIEETPAGTSYPYRDPLYIDCRLYYPTPSLGLHHAGSSALVDGPCMLPAAPSNTSYFLL